MKILLLEPFFAGSHKKWAEALQQYSTHSIDIISLEGRFWKWRMHGGAISLARIYQAQYATQTYDLVLASDMLNVPNFLAQTNIREKGTKVAIYFHENQLTYPWSSQDADVKLKRDNHYSFINLSSALCSDAVLFNSQYHQQSFINALPTFLKQFPDHNETWTVEAIHQKSQVLPLGMDFFTLAKNKSAKRGQKPLLLWNHRWEYDKNPEFFFNTLIQLKNKSVNFEVAVLGESYAKQPSIFNHAKKVLNNNIIHWGYVSEPAAYAKLLWQADVLPVTSNQDFFGISIVEAMYCNVCPLLPKRLAYPEHLPQKVHQTHFYQSPQEFTHKLSQFIYKINDTRALQFQQYVKHYAWANIIQRYDAVFQNIVNNINANISNPK